MRVWLALERLSGQSRSTSGDLDADRAQVRHPPSSTLAAPKSTSSFQGVRIAADGRSWFGREMGVENHRRKSEFQMDPTAGKGKFGSSSCKEFAKPPSWKKQGGKARSSWPGGQVGRLTEDLKRLGGGVAGGAYLHFQPKPLLNSRVPT